jgi:site-specific DNA recombinase
LLLYVEKLIKRKQEIKLVDDNLVKYINTVTKGLRKLPVYYSTATLSTKQRIISSMFPEKLVYENKSYRTPAINEAVRLISNPDGVFSELKEEQVSKNGDLSNWVVRLGFEPRLTESETVVLPLHNRTVL